MNFIDNPQESELQNFSNAPIEVTIDKVRLRNFFP